eukprot:12931469-Prorocentrum_lima.AAC.1
MADPKAEEDKVPREEARRERRGNPTLASAEWEDYGQENPGSWNEHEWADSAEDPGEPEEYQDLQEYY